MNVRPETMSSWIGEAECIGMTHIFFAPSGAERPQARERREAKARRICGECAVRAQCLDYALDFREPNGIWGGKNEDERQDMRRFEHRSA